MATAVIGCLGLISCNNHNHEEHSSEEPDRNEHDHDEIILSPESASRFGVTTSRADSAYMYQILPSWGALESVPGIGKQILSARSSGIVRLSSRAVPGTALRAGEHVADINGSDMVGGSANVNAIAAAELEAAQNELNRIEPLRKEGIVSERDYQAARAEVKRLSAAYKGTTTGSTVSVSRPATVTRLLVSDGQWVEAGTPLMETTSDSRLLLRVDIPLSHRDEISRIVGVNFATADAPDKVRSLSSLGGEIRADMNTAAAVGASGYMPVYFSIPNDGSLTAGIYADVWLLLDEYGQRHGIVVPKEAVVENEGEYFVYVRVDEHGYQKRRVSTGMTDGKTIEITSGISADDEVVVSGAMIVKMAENTGKIPESHHHNH